MSHVDDVPENPDEALVTVPVDLPVVEGDPAPEDFAADEATVTRGEE